MRPIGSHPRKSFDKGVWPGQGKRRGEFGSSGKVEDIGVFAYNVFVKSTSVDSKDGRGLSVRNTGVMPRVARAPPNLPPVAGTHTVESPLFALTLIKRAGDLYKRNLERGGDLLRIDATQFRPAVEDVAHEPARPVPGLDERTAELQPCKMKGDACR